MMHSTLVLATLLLHATSATPAIDLRLRSAPRFIGRSSMPDAYVLLGGEEPETHPNRMRDLSTHLLSGIEVRVPKRMTAVDGPLEISPLVNRDTVGIQIHAHYR